MSWSINTVLKNEDSPEGLQKAIVQLESISRENVGNQHCEVERDEQIDAAIAATTNLLFDAGILNVADEISVVMSGHANKNHQKDDSWSNEFISINVSVNRYREE